MPITVKHFLWSSEKLNVIYGMSRYPVTTSNVVDIVQKNNIDYYTVIQSNINNCLISGNYVNELSPISFSGGAKRKLLLLFNNLNDLKRVVYVTSATLENGNTRLTFDVNVDTTLYNRAYSAVRMVRFDAPVLIGSNDKYVTINFNNDFVRFLYGYKHGNQEKDIYHEEFGWMYALFPRYNPAYPLFSAYSQPGMTDRFPINPQVIYSFTFVIRRFPLQITDPWILLNGNEYQLVYYQGYGNNVVGNVPFNLVFFENLVAP